MKLNKFFLMSFLLLVVTCAATAMSFAESNPVHDDPPIDIIINGPGSENGLGPRIPVLIPVSGCVDTVLGAAFFSFSSPCGTVTIEMENLNDGSLLETEVNGTGTVVIPFAFSSGFWTVTITLESGAEYTGYFEID